MNYSVLQSYTVKINRNIKNEIFVLNAVGYVGYLQF